MTGDLACERCGCYDLRHGWDHLEEGIDLVE